MITGRFGPAAQRAAMVLALTLSLVPATVRAHGQLHEQIEALAPRIAAAPNDARLRLRRGELHRLHREWSAAMADYDAAARIDPALAEVHLGVGMLHSDRRDYASARDALTRFLSAMPNHIDARVARARAAARIGDFRAAASDYDEALRIAPPRGPDLYIERAQTLAALGGSDVDRALAGLDEALQRFGPLPAVNDVAIAIEREAGRQDAALARVDRVIESAARKERWLLARAEILAEAGRRDESREAFRSTLDAIEALPPQLRKVKATLALEDRARQGLR